MTYCDFKPGDEVVCVDAERRAPSIAHTFLMAGAGYVVEGFDGFTIDGTPRIFLVGVDAGCPTTTRASFRVSRFRKVQRRDIGKWLEQSTDFEEPKRAPAKETA